MREAGDWKACHWKLVAVKCFERMQRGKYCQDQSYSGFGKMFPGIHSKELQISLRDRLCLEFILIIVPVMYRLCSSCRTNYWNVSESYYNSRKRVLKITEPALSSRINSVIISVRAVRGDQPADEVTPKGPPNDSCGISQLPLCSFFEAN